MKKKILALCLVVVLAITAVTGATLAYFTDQDNASNVFTVGDLDIELKETAKVELPDETGKLEEEEDKLVPNKDQDGDGDDDGWKYINLVPGNEITKTPVVKNIGENTAYVRVAVVMNNVHEINNAIDEVYENLEEPKSPEEIQAIYDKVFEGWGINYGKTAEHVNRMWMTTPEGVLAVDTAAEYKGAQTWWNIDSANAFKNDVDDTAVEGTFYAEGSYYDKAIEAGERIYVYYLELEKDETFTPFTGLNVPSDFDSNRACNSKQAVDGKIDQMAMFENLQINIYVDAIQKEGFSDWKPAFEQLQADHPLGSDFYRTYDAFEETP